MKKRFKNVGSMKFPSPDIDSTRKYKPLSYFILGGVDLSGDQLKDNAEISFESEKSLSEMENQGVVKSIGVCDPRVDMFDIVEATTSEQATDAIESGEVKAE